MRLSVKALSATCGLVWGGALLLVGVGNLLWPAYGGMGYGARFLSMLEGLYPGYAMGGYPSLAVLVLYGLADGAITGAIVAALYNAVAARTQPRPAA